MTEGLNDIVDLIKNVIESTEYLTPTIWKLKAAEDSDTTVKLKEYSFE